MKLFPGDGHGLARLQVFDSSGNFFVPSLFNRQIGRLKAIEQRISQGSAFVTGKRECPFQ